MAAPNVRVTNENGMKVTKHMLGNTRYAGVYKEVHERANKPTKIVYFTTYGQVAFNGKYCSEVPDMYIRINKNGYSMFEHKKTGAVKLIKDCKLVLTEEPSSPGQLTVITYDNNRPLMQCVLINGQVYEHIEYPRHA